MYKRHRPDEARLYAIAESQQGLFTTKQVKTCGYAENTHPYHVRQGHWIRERRGIYRLALFPVSEEEQLVLWSLWSMNRKEEPQGVYSHATALRQRDRRDGNTPTTVPFPLSGAIRAYEQEATSLVALGFVLP